MIPIYRTRQDYDDALTLHESHVVALPMEGPRRCLLCRQDQPRAMPRTWLHAGALCRGGWAAYLQRCLRGPLCPHCAEGLVL